MSWNESNPPDTESVRNGANRIREFKTDVAAALSVEGVFPGPNPASPVYRYTPGFGNTGSRPISPTTGQLFINTTLGVIERYNGATWDPVATATPAGTVQAFFQAAAPVGWTQVITHNDAVLRVVNDGTGGGSGGVDSISAPPSHVHSISRGNATVTGGGATQVGPATTPPFDSQATIGFSPKYANVILCSKN